MPSVKMNDEASVLVTAPPWSTVTCTPLVSEAVSAVNSIASSVPPPPTGSCVTPTKLKAVSTADPVVSTEGALGAVSPPGALTFLVLGAAVLLPALAEPDGDADGDGDAEGSRPDSGL